jgi:chemotaxis protein methyltransferase CheR
VTTRAVQPQVFRLLASMVEESAGLHYEAKDAELVWDRMVGRAAESGFDSLLDYYYALRYDDPDGAQLRALVEALVVHETYLFREWDQLLAVVDGVIVPTVQNGQRVRVWSAACSTGEEPYSLAMLLDDRGVLDRVEISASDVSERALARARQGLLGPRALRAVPAPMHLARWGERDGERFQVSARIRAAVRFFQLNLFDPRAIAALPELDVILCRNVLIYFADAAVARVVGDLARALRPAGALFVGVSESLMRLGVDLVCEERRGVFLYRRGS